MHNFEAQVRKVMVNLQIAFSDRLLADGNFYFYPRKPKVSDIELLAISIVAESLSIHSENALFTRFSKEFPGLVGRISRPRFNIRRRALNIHMEDFFERCHNRLLNEGNAFVVDSTPLPVCKLGRLSRLRSCKDNPNIPPQYGYCHAKKEGYYGFKMHLITTQKSAVPVAFSITSAKVHDIRALEDLLDEKPELNGAQLLGDKGYVSSPLQLHLFESKAIDLKAKPRINMKTPLNWTPEMAAIRRTIETVFSQIHDQFRLGQNFARTFVGLVTRVTHKLAGLLSCQLINIQNGRSPNLIKSALFI